MTTLALYTATFLAALDAIIIVVIFFAGILKLGALLHLL